MTFKNLLQTSAIAAYGMRAMTAAAQVFNGGGIDAGLEPASEVTGVLDENPRTVVLKILAAILNYLALIAVIMVIIAGFYLVLSMGNDEQKDKAKKIIQYTLIGLVVILFSRVIVALVTVWLADQI